MKKFTEWVQENHPELDEGWAKNLAVGGALLGAGIGLGRATQTSNSAPNAPQQKISWLQQKKAEMARVKADMLRKTQGLKPGQSRRFIQGEPQPGIGSRDIESSSTTSPDADSYF